MPAPAQRHVPLRAFTLIELLTVIAIIGILAAILIPTLGAVRKSAATARDTSNLRQIGGAFHLHASEHKGLFPHRGFAITGMNPSRDFNSTDYSVQEAVDRYLNDRWKRNADSFYNHRANDVWYSAFAEPSANFVPSTTTGQTSPIAYGYNSRIDHPKWKGRLSAIPNPSRIVLLGEVNDTRSMTGESPPAIGVGDVVSAYRVNRNGKALYLFADGRAALLEGDQSHSTLIGAGKESIWRWFTL